MKYFLKGERVHMWTLSFKNMVFYVNDDPLLPIWSSKVPAPSPSSALGLMLTRTWDNEQDRSLSELGNKWELIYVISLSYGPSGAWCSRSPMWRSSPPVLYSYHEALWPLIRDHSHRLSFSLWPAEQKPYSWVTCFQNSHIWSLSN